MTITFKEGWFISLTFRRGVGIDLEFPDSKPVWVTLRDSKGNVLQVISEFEGMELLIPLFRICFGQLFERPEDS